MFVTQVCLCVYLCLYIGVGACCDQHNLHPRWCQIVNKFDLHTTNLALFIRMRVPNVDADRDVRVCDKCWAEETGVAAGECATCTHMVVS